MKEYTFIYFNDDGGVNISFLNSIEINKKINEILSKKLDSKEFERLFLGEEDIDSMYVDEDKKYMIIKGLPVSPIIKSQVTKAII